MVEIAVIGGGPAGLRVAQVASQSGKEVHLYDQKRSTGRKFLIAGKSGLNLTNAVAREAFLACYQGRDLPRDLWARMYDHFDNAALRQWAADLGQDTFVSSGNKVFPACMKAAPLLRNLLHQIKTQGGNLMMHHRFTAIRPCHGGYELTFITPQGAHTVQAERVVFALGGRSWPTTGADGVWTTTFTSLGLQVSPLQAANCGWELQWPPGVLEQYEGTPWKNISCRAGEQELQGELVITRYGLEGGPLYRLGHALRAMETPTLQLDFKPTFTLADLLKKAESVRTNLAPELTRRWRVPPSVITLMAGRFPDLFSQPKVTPLELKPLAEFIKNAELVLTGPRPITEAISSAGGIAWAEVDDSLQLHQFPGVYVCGEMLDWEAPTGGFLLQGCFSTASWVAAHLVRP